MSAGVAAAGLIAPAIVPAWADEPKRGGTLVTTWGGGEPQACYVPSGGGSSPTFSSSKLFERLGNRKMTGEFVGELAEGWKPIAIEWERPSESPTTTGTAPAAEVPFGLRVSGDCAHLEDDPNERAILFQIMELTIQDGPYSGIAEELNRRGLRTRDGSRWTPISIFQMLPRLIEAGPGILMSEEWSQRRQKLKSATP